MDTVFQRINKMYQVSVAEIEKEMLAYCLKGIKMIKLSDGVEISEDTVISALKKAGISVELKHIFQRGDIAYNEVGSKVHNSEDWRFIVSVNGWLCSVDKNGVLQGWGQKYFENCNYKYVGRQSDLLKG